MGSPENAEVSGKEAPAEVGSAATRRRRLVPVFIALALLALAAAGVWYRSSVSRREVAWEELDRSASEALRAGLAEEAALYLERAWTAAQRFPEGDPRRVATARRLASVLETAGRNREAESWALRALRESSQAGEVDPATAGALYAQMARLRWQRGERQIAASFARQALTYLEKVAAPRAEDDRIEALVVLARVAEREDELAEARERIEQAIALAERRALNEAGTAMDNHVARLLGAYAELSRRLGDDIAARQAENQQRLIGTPRAPAWWEETAP